jgi:hypothetical protein
MKTAVLVVALIAVLLCGEWVYRSFLRPIDPLNPQVLKLAEHFSNSDLIVRPYAVRHSFRHSQVTSAAALEIANFPLVVSVDVCPSQRAAVEAMARIRSSPNLTRPKQIGTLVTYLPMWGDDDTEAMAAKVESILNTYEHGT